MAIGMTTVIMDGKEIERLEIHSAGEEGYDFWILAITTKGEKLETGIVKGSV